MNTWLPLLGVAVVVAGFLLRFNPLLVVVVAGIVSSAIAGLAPLAMLELFGEAFLKNRYLALFVLTLPVIGLLERHGLREHAQHWIARLRGLTVTRLLLTYQALRQGFAAIGLPGLGGHAQTVRPLLAPMAEAAAQVHQGGLSFADRMRLRAWCAATDNVALFFGEDIFIAFGAVLLMQGFMAENGIVLEPLHIALWGIPTGIAAFAIHAVRIRRMAARLGHHGAAAGAAIDADVDPAAEAAATRVPPP